MNIKQMLLAPWVLARYGSLRPKIIRLPISDRKVAINPDDRRAYKKLVVDSVRGRVSTPMEFWRDHLNHLGRALCMDIGANYGECFACGDCSRAHCIVVEANPTLHPFLKQTRELHPNRDHITLVNCLAGDVDGETATLYYDAQWTGGGSAVKQREDATGVQVVTRTMDALVRECPDFRDAPLLVKIDVEGYEGKVLSGFSELFSRDNVTAIMEYDTMMLRRASTDPRGLFEKLLSRFIVYRTHKRKKTLTKLNDWSAFEKHFDGGEIHLDLALFSPHASIAPQWTIGG